VRKRVSLNYADSSKLYNNAVKHVHISHTHIRAKEKGSKAGNLKNKEVNYPIIMFLNGYLCFFYHNKEVNVE